MFDLVAYSCTQSNSSSIPAYQQQQQKRQHMPRGWKAWKYKKRWIVRRNLPKKTMADDLLMQPDASYANYASHKQQWTEHPPERRKALMCSTLATTHDSLHMCEYMLCSLLLLLLLFCYKLETQK